MKNKSSKFHQVNPKLGSYLFILLYLSIGLVVMGFSQLFKPLNWRYPGLIILFLFFIINIITSRLLKLKAEIRVFWAFRKAYLLPIGFITGGAIACSPAVAGLLAGTVKLNNLKFDTPFSVTSFLITLATVSWEELWFRGIFLNYCRRHLSAINISIAIGILFMLVHIMNPEINLLKTGPTLFFAGAFLTIIYFYFKSIWLPIGIHFGNNYLTIESSLYKHWFLGNDGYFSTIVLAVLFLIFAGLTMKKERNAIHRVF